MPEHLWEAARDLARVISTEPGWEVRIRQAVGRPGVRLDVTDATGGRYVLTLTEHQLESEPPTQKYADEVEPGDWIVWCGREIEIVDTKPGVTKRPGLYLIAEIDGQDRQLHYYADEIVALGAHTPGECA